MAKTKQVRTKKYRPPELTVEFKEKQFQYSKEDSVQLTMNTYLQLEYFARGKATNDNRTTLKIRLLAGIALLKEFEHEGVEELLMEALTLVHTSRNKETRVVRQMTANEIVVIHRALFMIDSMIEQCDLWQEVTSIKYAEDMCIIGADKFDYLFVKHVD